MPERQSLSQIEVMPETELTMMWQVIIPFSLFLDLSGYAVKLNWAVLWENPWLILSCLLSYA